MRQVKTSATRDVAAGCGLTVRSDVVAGSDVEERPLQGRVGDQNSSGLQAPVVVFRYSVG